MTFLLALHALTGAVAVTFGARLGRRALTIAVLGPLATVVWLLTQASTLLDGRAVTESVTWVPQLELAFDLRLDGFGALMVLLVSGIGVLVFAYSARYFAPQGPGLGRLIGLLALFSGSMLGVVVADNLLVLYGFWELTSITSFLLIGNDHEDGKARAAALQALLVTGAGGLAMLAGFFVLGHEAGTFRLSEILSDPPAQTATVTTALVLILLGAFTKSAQAPFHGWLPGAMVAPTPISAYLHSATMVKAGVYLIARLSPAFADMGFWKPLVVGVGVATMLVGGLRALRQTDLKLLLALGTVSQLGFMTAVLGLGTDEAIVAGCVLLLSHGAFKAADFMVVGIVDHQRGSRDVRELPRPGPGWGPTVASAVISSASMAGIPLAVGFIAKEAAFEALVHTEGSGEVLALAGIVAGSALTAAYSLRFVAGILGRLADPDHVLPDDAGPGPPAIAFVLPALLLSAFTVAAGVVPRLVDGIADSAAGALSPGLEAVHLSLWHGLNVPLLLSVLALAGGVALYAGRRAVDPVLATGRRLPLTSSGGYAWSLRGLNLLADRVTGVVQPGSLPIYIGVIAFTAAVIPGALLLSGAWWPGWPALFDTWVHIPIVAVILAAAMAASYVRRRFTAALFLGVVGYAMAGLFIIRGAPDLALTQVGIETLTTVLFVLVLRRLPDRFEHRTPQWRRALRVAVAGTIALTVFVLAMVTGSEEPPLVASDAMIERALPDGEGRNVVNVILVDFRGWDTLGEITVLTAASIGAVALARAGRRPARVVAAEAAARRREREGADAPVDEGRPATAPTGPDRPPAVAPPAVSLSRMITLETSTRVVFIALMLGSLYLLFVGHNQPGGGFAGGIVAGAAVALRYISGGIEEVRRISRGRPWWALGTGVLLAAGTALVPLLVGGSVLETGSVALDIPLLGKVKLTSALAFDAGVYLVVLGLALMVFESFGDDPPARHRAAARPAEPAGASADAEVPR